MKDKVMLKDAGLTSYERKCVYEAMIEIIGKKQENYFTEKLVVFNAEISFAFDASNVNDWGDMNYDEWLNFVSIYDVKKYDIEALLEKASIEYDSSGVSESVYFTLNGKEYRVSTHKRPAYADATGLYHDHTYENEIICKNEIDMYNAVEKIIKENINANLI